MPKIGKSQIRKDHLDRLTKAWRKNRLVLFLGAGISTEFGIPQWPDLVFRLLSDEETLEQKLEQKLEQTGGPDDLLKWTIRVRQWVVNNYQYDPMMLAQVAAIKIRERCGSADSRSDFRKLVREHLYENLEPPKAKSKNTTMSGIVDLLGKGTTRQRGVAAIVTFNFDDLLERELERTRIAHHTIATEKRPRKSGLPILHVHGSLPQEGDLLDNKIVFTEGDYHELSYDSVHWATNELLTYLRNYTVLFVGISMTDPNLRRLATAAKPSGAEHFITRKSYANPSETTWDKMMHEVFPNASSKEKKGFLHGLIQKAKQNFTASRVAQMAKDIDERLFDDMNIHPVWVEEFEDIPKLLRRIGKKPRSSSKTGARRKASGGKKRTTKKTGKGRAK